VPAAANVRARVTIRRASSILKPLSPDGTFPPPTPDDIGHEPTWEGYVEHVVRRDFRALKRVLRPDGVLVVVIDDVIANPASIYDEQTYLSTRTRLKLSSQIAFRSQDTTKMWPKGNWLGLPWLFAAAMMDDGWVGQLRVDPGIRRVLRPWMTG
jgi:hypothetical protein